MSSACIIEIAGASAGIVAADANGFRFHAALHQFNALDGRIFSRPCDAERAARSLFRRSSAPHSSQHPSFGDRS